MASHIWQRGTWLPRVWKTTGNWWLTNRYAQGILGAECFDRPLVGRQEEIWGPVTRNQGSLSRHQGSVLLWCLLVAVERAAHTFEGGNRMDSGMIGKIQKAKQYAEERNRIEFVQFSVTLEGENHNHNVTYNSGRWDCQCSYFASHGVCSHTMAMERILGEMLRPTKVAASEAQPA